MRYRTLRRMQRGWQRRARHKRAQQREREYDDDKGLPLWVWGLLAAGVLWLWYLRPRREEQQAELPRRDAGSARPAGAVAEPARAEARTASTRPTAARARQPAARKTAASASDDLTRIEGIGPATARRLKSAGIRTFDDLARTDRARLEEIVSRVGLGLADPSTWPDQARLAARNDWDGLKAYQAELKAGRRQ